MDHKTKLLDNHGLIGGIARLGKEIGSLITDQLKEAKVDLTKSQTIVLSKLVHIDCCTQCDLAIITERDKTSLTRLLGTMERKKLILRQSCKLDKRVKEVSISEFGRKQYNIARPIVQKILNQAESGIEEVDLDHAKKVIINIYNNLNLEYEK